MDRGKGCIILRVVLSFELFYTHFRLGWTGKLLQSLTLSMEGNAMQEGYQEPDEGTTNLKDRDSLLRKDFRAQEEDV